jgi:PAS domain S-box-containing protein
MQNRELRRAHDLLERSRGKYADLYDLAPIGYCAFDVDGRVLEANLRAAELFNTTRRDLVGRLLTTWARIDAREEFRRHLHACLSRQACPPCELTVTAPGRPEVVIELVSTPVVDGDDSVIGCRTTLHDITNAKLAERRLTLLADVSELVTSSLDITKTFGELARLVVPLVADHVAIDVTLDEERRTFSSDEGVAVSSHSPFGPQSEVLRSGEPMYGESLLCLPLRARGATVGVMTLTVDGRKFSSADVKLARSLAARVAMAVDNASLYPRARAAARAREDVLAVVSHDLKNPLHAIRLNAELMAQASADDRSLRSILRSVQGMQRMIDDLLDLARLEAGHLVLSVRQHRIASMTADALELMAPLAEAKGLTLRGPTAPLGHFLRCDRDRLLQVLSNLVGNAVKFTDAGGTVTLDVDVVGDEARFVVRDSGCGIAPAQVAHVFDRYWQGDPNVRRRGSGLGLFITRGIVEAHHGRITVASELGAGTTVTVYVGGIVEPTTSRLPSASLAPVLVVDDDADFRELVAVALRARGYRVRTAANGSAAIAECRAERPARPGLVLVDLRMPVMDGWQLCHAMRSDPALDAIPIALLSAEPDLEEEARALGAITVLRKPVDVEVLCELVDAYCIPSAPQPHP